MMELVDVYKIRLPKFTVKVGLQYMRRVIQKKAKFDIMDINALKVAPKTFIPALFAHAKGDKFIQPHHSDLLSKSYAGEQNMIKFDGDHNSGRPQFYYDSVSIFFQNVLHPPPTKCYHSMDVEQEDKACGETEECCSDRESWGRCSSLGSVGEPFPDCPMPNDNDLVTLKVLGNASAELAKEKKRRGLSQRLRHWHCILKRKRNHSS